MDDILYSGTVDLKIDNRSSLVRCSRRQSAIDDKVGKRSLIENISHQKPKTVNSKKDK